MKKMFFRGAAAAACALVMSPMQVSAQQTAGQVMSLTLDKAVEIALSENPTILVADQQIELKKVSRNEAWQNLLPSVDFSGSVQYTLLAATMKLNDMEFKMGRDNTSTWNGQLSVSLPLFAPTVYATMNMTETDLLQAVEQARSSRLSLVNQVTKAYYQLLLAQDSYEVLKQGYDNAEENFNVINSKFGVGKASEYDKISADVQMRSLKPNLLSAANAIHMAQLQLKVLMGIDSDVELEIKGSLSDYENMMYADVLDDQEEYYLGYNSNLRQLGLNEELLNHTLRIQKMNFLPTLALSGSYSMQSLYNEDFKIQNYTWANSSSIVLSLSVPIFRMGNFTKLRSTKLQISQLAENRKYTEKQLSMQVKSYTDNMKSYAEQVASNRISIEQAEKGREIATKRYEIGNGTILELNGSEVALTQARLTYSQSIFNYLAAKADLDMTLGTNEE